METLYTNMSINPKRYKYLVTVFELSGRFDKNGDIAWRWHTYRRIYCENKKQALHYVGIATVETCFKATLKKLTKGGK